MTDRWTPKKVEALADAMWQLLDDMGATGHSVCEAAKAQARIAFEPFRVDETGEDAPLDYPLDEAERVIAYLNRQSGRMAGRDR